MKKLLLLLALAAALTLCRGAKADVLKLPAELVEIESEAFQNDTALDVVELPWGVETIGSKAFANSSVTKIYIPGSVRSIAPDAFDGTQAVICSAPSGYGSDYAGQQGLAWENSGGHYVQDAHSAIRGTVLFDVTGEPLSGAVVTCGGVNAVTDANGGFFIRVTEGSYTITAALTGYLTSEPIQVDVEDGQEKTVEIRLRDCIQIWNRQDLENVANDPNTAYALCADIDLSQGDWSPLPWFGGTLDGGGHVIRGMKVTSGDSVGFFMGLYGGTVYNLQLLDFEVDVNMSAQYNNVGGLGGTFNNQSKVENCTLKGVIKVESGSGTLWAGGFTGYIGDAQMKDCFVDVTMTVHTNQTNYVGGIAGNTDNCTLKNCDAQVDISVQQSYANSSASFNAAGIPYSSKRLSEDCDVWGSISIQTMDAACSASGISRTKNGHNQAWVTCVTTSGEAHAFGAIECENTTNEGRISAASIGSGNVYAVGVNGTTDMVNGGTVMAVAKYGNASATGAQYVGNNSRNSGAVEATSESGKAEAVGLSGNSAKECSNSGWLAARSTEGSATGIGMTSCADSENVAGVHVEAGTGNAVGQGISQCGNSTNSGDVTVIYHGPGYGGLSAQGLNNCNGSVNMGSVHGEVRASTTACTVTGAAGGTGNTNRGRVEAESESGQANARGVYCNNSTNYGDIYAESTCDTVSEISNATAYGVGPGYSNCSNLGWVTAISKSSIAYAYGFGSGCTNTTSTGKASATSKYFVIRHTEDGDEGELGRAYARNSKYTSATVGSGTVSAEGNETWNLYYFFAPSSCPDHQGMARKFVTYNQASEPDLDGCFIPVGIASAVSR